MQVRLGSGAVHRNLTPRSAELVATATVRLGRQQITHHGPDSCPFGPHQHIVSTSGSSLGGSSGEQVATKKKKPGTDSTGPRYTELAAAAATSSISKFVVVHDKVGDIQVIQRGSSLDIQHTIPVRDVRTGKIRRVLRASPDSEAVAIVRDAHTGEYAKVEKLPASRLAQTLRRSKRAVQAMRRKYSKSE